MRWLRTAASVETIYIMPDAVALGPNRLRFLMIDCHRALVPDGALRIKPTRLAHSLLADLPVRYTPVNWRRAPRLCLVKAPPAADLMSLTYL